MYLLRKNIVFLMLVVTVAPSGLFAMDVPQERVEAKKEKSLDFDDLIARQEQLVLLKKTELEKAESEKKLSDKVGQVHERTRQSTQELQNMLDGVKKVTHSLTALSDAQNLKEQPVQKEQFTQDEIPDFDSLSRGLSRGRLQHKGSKFGGLFRSVESESDKD